MRIDSSINPIKTEEITNLKPSFSVAKIVTAVALAAIALAVYAISSQQPKALIPSLRVERNLEEHKQFAAASPLCTRAIKEFTQGEYAPTNVLINKHHNHCVCFVPQDELNYRFIACTKISEEDQRNLTSTGANLKAPPFQHDLTTNGINACFQISPEHNLRTDS